MAAKDQPPAYNTVVTGKTIIIIVCFKLTMTPTEERVSESDGGGE
jgi:hypothetical protein